MSPSIDPLELARCIAARAAPPVLDVRSPAEFARAHVPGAINIPFHAVHKRIKELPGAPDAELVVYCGHGPRAYIAAAVIRRFGPRRIRYLRGHWAGWLRAGLAKTDGR